VQTAYHNRSLVLYTRLGFVTREPLSVIKGSPLASISPDTSSSGDSRDIAACNQNLPEVTGSTARRARRSGARKKATVVEHLGRITAMRPRSASLPTR